MKEKKEKGLKQEAIEEGETTTELELFCNFFSYEIWVN